MTTAIDELEEFISLSSAEPRYVRTVEGSEFYGLPIGSPITADIETAKVAAAEKLGIAPPKNALSGTSKSTSSQGAGSKLKIKIKKSSLTGNKNFAVGKANYKAPAGSKLIRSKKNATASFVYVLTPEGKVHAFNESGEVDIPTSLGKVLATKFSGDLTDDEKYEEIDFDSTSSPYDMSSLSVGAVLEDNRGTPQFKKTSDGTWAHVDLGVEVDEKDLQGFYDSGELVPQRTPEDDALQSTFGEIPQTSFSEMSQAEVTAALNELSSGTSVHATISDSPLQFTKQDDGKWKTDIGDNKVRTSEDLSLFKGFLTVGKHPEPNATEEEEAAPAKVEEPAAPAPKKEAKKKAPVKAVVEPTPEVEAAPAEVPEEVPTEPSAPELPKGAEQLKFLDLVSHGDFIVQVIDNPDAPSPFMTFQKTGVETYVDQEEGMGWEWPAASLEGPLSEGKIYLLPSAEEKDGDVKSWLDSSAKPKSELAYDGDPSEDAAMQKATSEDLDAAEVGDIAVWHPLVGTPETYSKAEQGKWSRVDTPGETFNQKEMDSALEFGHIFVPVNKSKSMKKPVEVIEEFSTQWLNEVEVGTIIDYEEKDDDPLKPPIAHWLKQENGIWLNSKSGVEFTDAELADLISNFSHSTTYKVKAVKSPGDKITSVEEMDDLDSGSVLAYEKKDGTSSFYTKLESGDWLTPGGKAMPASDLKTSAASGKFTVDTVGALKPVSGNESTDLDVAFELGGQVFSKAEIQEALNALESHSSFQIAYGLKSVPDNPLAKLPKDQLKVWAKTAYPDLPPKQGTVQLFKDKLGIETAAPDAAPEADGPTALIGSADSKTTATGVTGGEFTKADIEGAIAILEGFSGKIFKSELNKKGNPLGKLSPNDIVGFDKDKTVTKQKFLDLLKSKLAKFPAEKKASEKTAETTPLSLGEFKSLSVGKKVVFNSPATKTAHTYTRMDDGSWESETNGIFDVGEFDPFVEDGLVTALDEDPIGDMLTQMAKEQFENQSKAPEVSLLDSKPEAPKIPTGPSLNGKLYKADDDFSASIGDAGGAYITSVHAIPEGLPLPTLNALTGKMDADTPGANKGGQHDKATNTITLGESMNPEGSFVHEYGHFLDHNLFGHISNPHKGAKTKEGDSFWGAIQAADTFQQIQKEWKGNPTMQEYLQRPAEIFARAYAQWVDLRSGNSIVMKNYDGWTDEKFEPIAAEFDKLFSSRGLLAPAPVPAKAAPAKLTEQDLLDLPVGSRVLWDDIYLTKLYDSDNWYNHDKSYSTNAKTLAGKNPKLADPIDADVPEYAKTPEAVQDKTQDEAAAETPVTNDEVVYAAIGTVFRGSNNIFYSKFDDASWEGFNDKGEAMYVGNGSTVKALANDGELFHMEQINPEFNKSGLTPGKYSTGGKAYMVVKADGAGVYVNSKGDVTNLTVAKVKSNHKAGMNKYMGMPDNIPTANPAAPKVKPKTTESIADGTYFNGIPTALKTWVYEVNGDDVKVFKPKTSTGDFDLKVGQKTTGGWIDAASPGAKFSNKYYEESYYTKQADGTWVDAAGEVATESVISAAKYWYTDYRIRSHGTGEPVTLTKAKLQTLFAQGKLIDSDGNSVVPAGYSGNVSYFGAEVTIPALLKAQKMFEDVPDTGFTELEDEQQFKTKLTGVGLLFNAPLMKKYAAKNYSEIDAQARVQIFKTTINQMVSGLDTDIPESDASKLFQWNEQAEAVFPKTVAIKQEDNNLTGTAAWIKEASAAIGDGGIIGQHVTKMDLYERVAWIKAFRDGDFVAMYKLEVKAAAAQGKAHVAGYKHPGYEENEGTHQIAWAAAVEGEISASKTIEGDWTSLSVEASVEEINNYLIKAQMQNPQHLNMTERRTWVKWHRNKQKRQVDHYSVMALNRKTVGEATLSDPLEWTDDVVPAKSYDVLFDDDPHPTEGWHQGSKAMDYYTDKSGEIPELVELYEKEKDNNGYSGEAYWARMAVQNYFTAEKEKAYQLSLIPVYTKKPVQTVKQGTHPIAEYTDQWGNEFFFKPRPDTPSGKFRAEVEGLGNSLGRFWGFNSAEPRLVTVDGQYGLMQGKISGVGDLMGADYGTLTAEQIADIGGEHVLDWLLDNDDTKGDNAIILGTGHIVGIDKGRSFRAYGSWEGLSGDYHADSNAPTIYTKLFDSMRSGSIDKERADKAYLLLQRRIDKVMRSHDDSIRNLMVEGMKSRDKGYDVPYFIDGKKVPQTFDGLVTAVLDRRNRLKEDFEELWGRVYKESSLGDLPEVPKNPLGDVLSGFGDVRLHEEVLTAGIGGKTTMLGGPQIVGGTALLWTDTYKGGAVKNLNGEIFLGPKKQKELLNFLISKTGTVSPDKASTQGFDNYDTFYAPIVGAAKTVNHHAVDKEYNQEKIDAFLAVKKEIEADLAAWTPDLEANTTHIGEPAFKFPSGKNISMNHVDQYKLMLEYYTPGLNSIEQAYNENGKVEPKIEKYTALVLTPKPEKLTSVDGTRTATKLDNGMYLYKDTKSATVQVLATADLPDGPWQAPEEQTAEPKKDGYKVFLRNNTNELSGTMAKNEKTVIENQHTSEGSPGSEYEIVLDTGERIFFRNSGHTNTKKGQQGKLMFRADGAGSNSSQLGNSLDRIEGILNVIGIDTEAADHNHAELTYWREMYGVLQNRVHEKDSGLANAYEEMQGKMKSFKGDEIEFLEDLSASMDPEEEVQWWRKLHSTHISKERVDKLVAEEAYLPQFDHQNLFNPEQETGKPYWMRYDIDVADVYAEGKFLMSTTKKDPLNQVKAGSALGAEERFRQNGFWINGWSGHEDQSRGSSHNIYTRIMSDAKAKDYTGFYDPKTILRTRSYSFSGDMYGDLAARKTSAPSDPISAIKKFGGVDGNETLLPHIATLLDTVEIYAFDYAEKRNEAIQYLKALGIEQIRGLPVEDRLVMRMNIQAAIQKVKSTWAKKQ